MKKFRAGQKFRVGRWGQIHLHEGEEGKAGASRWTVRGVFVVLAIVVIVIAMLS